MKPLLCALALAALVAPARAAYLDSNQAVSAETQVNGGGCYPIAKLPQLTDQLVLINPEWAAIDVGPHTPPACAGCMAGETCMGTVFNYHSELHPPQAVAVSRLGAGHAFSRRRKGGRLATRTDVWITPDGGGAGDRCVVTHRPNPFDLVSATECFPLSQPPANVNASNFEFDIPLPPRPAGS